jgi:hypothetical protein
LEELDININILEKYSYNFSSNSIQDFNLNEDEDISSNIRTEEILNHEDIIISDNATDTSAITLIINRLWEVMINSIFILKLCRKLDSFDCKSIYRM